MAVNETAIKKALSKLDGYIIDCMLEIQTHNGDNSDDAVERVRDHLKENY